MEGIRFNRTAVAGLLLVLSTAPAYGQRNCLTPTPLPATADTCNLQRSTTQFSPGDAVLCMGVSGFPALEIESDGGGGAAAQVVSANQIRVPNGNDLRFRLFADPLFDGPTTAYLLDAGYPARFPLPDPCPPPDSIVFGPFPVMPYGEVASPITISDAEIDSLLAHPDSNGDFLLFLSPGSDLCQEELSTFSTVGLFLTRDPLATPTPTPFLAMKINEVDRRNDSGALFLELYDGGVGNVPLDELVVALYTGNTDEIQRAFDIRFLAPSPQTDPDGFTAFFLTNSVPADVEGVALYALQSSALLPTDGSGPVPICPSLIDAVVYKTEPGVPDDPELAALLLEGQAQLDESSFVTSLQRCPDGAGATRTTDRFAPAAASLGGANFCITITPTPSPTPSAVLDTATPTQVALTPTATAPGSDTPTPGGRCVGDCDGNGQVAINELVRGVGAALAGGAPENCASLDANGDGMVSINELVRAVANALSGCV